MTPENYDIEKQIYFFSNAKLVVGNHGAGLANFTFCKTGTRVFEWTVAEIQINDWMKNLSQTLGLDYRYIEIMDSSDILNFKEIVLAKMRGIDHS